MFRFIRNNPGRAALCFFAVAGGITIVVFTAPISGPVLIAVAAGAVVFGAAGAVCAGIAVGQRSARADTLKEKATEEEREGLTADAAAKDKEIRGEGTDMTTVLARLTTLEARATVTEGRVDTLEDALKESHRQQVQAALAMKRDLAVVKADTDGHTAAISRIGMFAGSTAANDGGGDEPTRGVRRRPGAGGSADGMR